VQAPDLTVRQPVPGGSSLLQKRCQQGLRRILTIAKRA